MSMIYLGLVIALSGAAILYLYYRLTKTKEALFAAKRPAAHAQARQQGARRAAQVAEKRCTQVLGQMETALAQTGQALEIAGHIELAGQHLHGLIDYLPNPYDAPPPLHYHPAPPRLPHPHHPPPTPRPPPAHSAPSHAP